MKKILLSLMSLLFAVSVFAQRMEWNEDYVMGLYKGSFTYVDSTKITYNSGDGMLFFTYELSGDVLSYDIYLNIPFWATNYWYYSAGREDSFPAQEFWNVDLPNYNAGPQHFSDSFILDFDEPTPLMLVTGFEGGSPFGIWGAWLFSTYYPS